MVRFVLMCPIETRTIGSTPLRVSRDHPLPIAEQIESQLTALIRTGTLRPGERLPPVRVLAGFLRVNRNTVAKVYAALERARVVTTTPGRGTYIASTAQSSPPETLIPLADRLLDEATALGLTDADARALIAERAVLRRRRSGPTIGFVECNPSDLAYFSRQLTARLQMPLVPLLLPDLSRAASSLDLIATTLFHVEEVRRLAPRHEVVGLMAIPALTTLDTVARLPPRSRIALVCATLEGVRSKERSIRAVGIQQPHLMIATLHQPSHLRRILRRADVVLASPKVLERIEAQISRGARIIPFASVLSEGAVALLEDRIRAWRAKSFRRAGARRVGA